MTEPATPDATPSAGPDFQASAAASAALQAIRDLAKEERVIFAECYAQALGSIEDIETINEQNAGEDADVAEEPDPPAFKGEDEDADLPPVEDLAVTLAIEFYRSIQRKLAAARELPRTKPAAPTAPRRKVKL